MTIADEYSQASQTVPKYLNKDVHDSHIDMKRVATIILGGGEGSRLYPLTASRCKPAISFAGRYRLIDVPISNSLNSGCHKIFILTQFLSSSLHQHIFNAYRNDIFTSGFVELLPAEQKPTRREWFQGTADAVRQNTDYFIECPADYFLILSGDQLYNIDFRDMMRVAKSTDADVVIAGLHVPSKDTHRMGIMRVDEESLITDFIEKPKKEADLAKYQISQAALESYEKSHKNEKCLLASMGIYLFKREFLLELLEVDKRADFGKHLIPYAVANGKAACYLHQGYWEDIGTIEAFYRANINLTTPDPHFDLYNENLPLYTYRDNLPAPKITDAKIKDSLICEGSIIEAAEVSQSILGPRTVIRKGTKIKESYVMGNVYYQPPVKTKTLPEKLEIGENCRIQKAIIDRHVWIGNGVQLINKEGFTNYDGDKIHVRDGIIVIARGATLPDGFVF